MLAPAVVPAAGVLLGVLTASLLPAWSSAPAAVVSVLLVGIAAASWVANRGWLAVISASLSFFCGGLALAVDAGRSVMAPPLCETLAVARPPPFTSTPTCCSLVVPTPVALEGRIRQDADLLDRYVRLQLDVSHVEYRGRRVSVSGGTELRVSGALAAAAAEAWVGGRTVRLTATLREPGVFRDPGVPDARVSLARRGIVLTGTVKSAALVEVVRPATFVEEAAARVRRFTREAVQRHVGQWSTRSATILVAILIGDRAGLDADVQRRLQEAGTYHVIAISGGNIAILTGVLLFLVRLLHLGPRWGSVLAILALVSYAQVVGAGASVVRATTMAVMYFAGRLVDQRGAGLNAIAVAALAILAHSPFALFDAGFLLTFGATTGIVIGAQWARLWRRGPRWARPAAALLLASVCAEAALLPVAARLFSRVTFAGLLVNFAAIPLMTLAQTAGMALVASAALLPRLAMVAGWLAHLGADGLVQSARVVDALPWLSYRLPPPALIPIVAYYSGWCAWFLLRGPARHPGLGRARRLVRRTALAVIVFAAIWILVEPVSLLWPGVSGRLRVVVLDVGHADAILVQLPDRRSVLVDAGGSITASAFDIGSRVVAPALWALGTRRLDALILTHPDPDHVGGAESVVRDFRPRAIWEGIAVPRSPARERLQRLAADLEIPWRSRQAGDEERFGEVRLRVWHPPPSDWERQRPRNDDSLVLELQYGGLSVVLPGDIGQGVERDLVPLLAPAAVRALKVAHHGSVSSSGEEFLRALSPGVALLSAGAITRVSPVVLQRYEALSCPLFRTDRDGALTLESDGRLVAVHTFTGRRWEKAVSNRLSARRP